MGFVCGTSCSGGFHNARTALVRHSLSISTLYQKWPLGSVSGAPTSYLARKWCTVGEKGSRGQANHVHEVRTPPWLRQARTIQRLPAGVGRARY